MALDEAGLDQQLQVPRHAGLGLAEDVDEFADRDFRLGEEREKAQARDFSSGLEACEDRGERCVRVSG